MFYETTQCIGHTLFRSQWIPPKSVYRYICWILCDQPDLRYAYYCYPQTMTWELAWVIWIFIYKTISKTKETQQYLIGQVSWRWSKFFPGIYHGFENLRFFIRLSSCMNIRKNISRSFRYPFKFKEKKISDFLWK